ncbi:MAG: DUF3883 domain-containing protein [Chthonomonadetes bacterium]|nr:DUF3883 domain-containing protein [Chthonomonadetes bacterium]
MLQPGTRVRLVPEDQIAEVYRFEPLGTRYAVGLILESTQQAVQFVLGEEELKTRLQVLPSLRESFLQGAEVLPGEQCVPFVEALRMRLAHAYDPHYAVSVTQVDLLPHQVDAVYRHILPQPQVRFLLADDPGLGKTIMAGLVLKELKARGLVQTVLIIVPAHLRDQWQREMWEWFREDFTPLHREVMQNLFAQDFFQRNPQLLTSMDFARQEPVRDLLAQHHWDLVIVDEAHKFSASRYGRKVVKTKRYQLGEALSRNASHLLLLTATPHRGDDESYFLLLDLLQPRLFARAEDAKAAARAGQLPFVLRRSKEQVTDMEGKPLFRKREVNTLSVRLTEAEKRLYDAVTAYVQRWYGLVSGRTDRRSRNVALALTVLQRRLSSSLFAVRESLRRRRAKLQNLLQEWERRMDEDTDLRTLDEDDLLDLEDETSSEWEAFQQKLEGLTAAQTPDDLRREIAELEDLIRLAQEAEQAGEEAKVNELRRVVEERLRHYPDEKLIVFTEFKDTLFALQRKLETEWGFPVTVIHGEMGIKERIEQERLFRTHTQVLVATDAAGEGLNLQFARLMVNFDLPWNPNRLEQRMGRIHRYGQKRDCYVFNMLHPETREGEVLQRLMEKLERMRERLGDSVYDVVGFLLEDVRLEELIMQAIVSGDTASVELRLEQDMEQRLKEYERALRESALAGHHIDLSAVLADSRDSRQRRLVPWDVERFTRTVAPLLGGECQPDARKEGVFRLRLPRTFLRQHRLEAEAYVHGVSIAFSRNTAREAGAEFFAPGHPVFEALCDHFLQKSRPVKTVMVAPHGEQGVLWLFRAGVQDGLQRPVLQRLIALFWDASTGEVREVDPRMLWDMKPAPLQTTPPPQLLETLHHSEQETRRWLIAYLDRLREEAAQRREREANIKRQWLERSYEYLIRESDRKLLDYDSRAEAGQDMRLAIEQERENLKRLVREREERLDALQKEQTLTVLEPQLEAIVLVCAEPSDEERGDAGDPESVRRIEAIGMEVAMRYEREQGRQPVDVSREYVGYDIRSEGGGEVRCIEVKAFATTGDVYLTSHEWQMAQRLKDEYWLYVVENAATQPHLHPIQNPADRLPAEQVVDVVGYVIRNWSDEGSEG